MIDSENHSFQGILPAVFTPFHANGDINLEAIPALVDRLCEQGISGIYALGSTGEGISMTSEERQSVAEAYIEAARDRTPVIIQVGHNSVRDACRLAAHAESAGAFALSAVAPTYFAHKSLDTLIDCMTEIAAAAPTLPFYYYHIPALTKIPFGMLDFMQRAAERIPTLRGIKFTSTEIYEFQECVEFEQGRFDVLYGYDEMLLSALSVGARGAVGTTYNLLAPLYLHLLDCFSQNDWDEARRAQSQAIKVIQVLRRFGVLPSCKAIMKMNGLDCGPCRLPLDQLSPEDTMRLKQDLEAVGFSTTPSNGAPTRSNTKSAQK